MNKRPSGKEHVTASAGESNGHTSCNTIPVAGKFPMRKPNQDERVAKTHDTNRKPLYLPRRSPLNYSVSPGPAKVQDSVRPGNSELAEALLTK